MSDEALAQINSSLIFLTNAVGQLGGGADAPSPPLATPLLVNELAPTFFKYHLSPPPPPPNKITRHAAEFWPIM